MAKRSRRKPTPPPVHLNVRTVPVGDLRPNPWNPNTMTPEEERAVGESIDLYGFLDPVTVRPIARGKYQILDGEHRWRAAKRAGRETVLVNVLDVPDDLTAKKLTLILNQRGGPDRVELARLLAELQRELGKDVGKGLPYTADELASIIATADARWRENEAPTSGGPPLAPGAPGDAVIHFVVPSAAAPVVERALKAVPGMAADDRPARLAAICQAFLDSPEEQA